VCWVPMASLFGSGHEDRHTSPTKQAWGRGADLAQTYLGRYYPQKRASVVYGVRIMSRTWIPEVIYGTYVAGGKKE